ncbi:MAG TPA: hypothetical protein VLV83_16675 [Acidobacteriota bacterium]|nr:hypothetical protein [Acidobacteriota bacterium]
MRMLYLPKIGLSRLVPVPYRWADKEEKGAILNEFLAATGYSRKHAIVLLNQPAEAPTQRAGGRGKQYDEQVRQALVQLWEAANLICAKRLVPFIPEFGFGVPLRDVAKGLPDIDCELSRPWLSGPTLHPFGTHEAQQTAKSQFPITNSQSGARLGRSLENCELGFWTLGIQPQG